MFRAIPNWELRMMTIAPLTRRRLLAPAAATSTLTLAGGIARPYLSRAADRPGITHGLQSGDTSVNSGVVWARTDRPARLTFDLATDARFPPSLKLRRTELPTCRSLGVCGSQE